MYYYGYGQQCQGYNYGGGYFPYYGCGFQQPGCGGTGSTWAIILVLFILLVIVLGIGLNR